MPMSETIDGQDHNFDQNDFDCPKIILTQIHSVKTTTFLHTTISAMAQY